MNLKFSRARFDAGEMPRVSCERSVDGLRVTAKTGRSAGFFITEVPLVETPKM